VLERSLLVEAASICPSMAVQSCVPIAIRQTPPSPPEAKELTARCSITWSVFYAGRRHRLSPLSRRRPSGNGGSVTPTGPLWAGLNAPDQRPSTGAIERYFSCCLSAGVGNRAGTGARRPPHRALACANSARRISFPTMPANRLSGQLANGRAYNVCSHRVS
jgi:hypothetical protein